LPKNRWEDPAPVHLKCHPASLCHSSNLAPLTSCGLPQVLKASRPEAAEDSSRSIRKDHSKDILFIGDLLIISAPLWTTPRPMAGYPHPAPVVMAGHPHPVATTAFPLWGWWRWRRRPHLHRTACRKGEEKEQKDQSHPLHPSTSLLRTFRPSKGHSLDREEREGFKDPRGGRRGLRR